MSGHVLVIGVDGTRFDALSADATPAIWAADVLTPITIDDATPSWSGPCWANIATGVPVDQHGVTGNDLSGHQLATHPDFLTVATRAGFSTLLAVAGWPPLATDEDGGPLFAEVSRREFVEASEGDGMAAWDVADETVTSLTVSIIEADGPQASFVYLGAVDIAGHLIGAGADYHAAVRAADQRVGLSLCAGLRQGAALPGRLVECDRARVRGVERASRAGDRDADHGVARLPPGRAEPSRLVPDDEENRLRKVKTGDVRSPVLVRSDHRYALASRPDQNVGG